MSGTEPLGALQIGLFFTRRYRIYSLFCIPTATGTKVLGAIVTRSFVCLLTELQKAAHQTTHRTKQHNLRNFPTRYLIRYLIPNVNQHSSTRHQ